MRNFTDPRSSTFPGDASPAGGAEPRPEWRGGDGLAVVLVTAGLPIGRITECLRGVRAELMRRRRPATSGWRRWALGGTGASRSAVECMNSVLRMQQSRHCAMTWADAGPQAAVLELPAVPPGAADDGRARQLSRSTGTTSTVAPRRSGPVDATTVNPRKCRLDLQIRRRIRLLRVPEGCVSHNLGEVGALEDEAPGVIHETCDVAGFTTPPDAIASHARVSPYPFRGLIPNDRTVKRSAGSASGEAPSRLAAAGGSPMLGEVAPPARIRPTRSADFELRFSQEGRASAAQGTPRDWSRTAPAMTRSADERTGDNP